MAKPRVLVLKAAGINCDQETAFAFRSAGAETDFVHINQLVSSERKLDAYQILAISGGFTYGDDIAAGRILANELRSKLFDGLKSFIGRDRLIIGICNGFQVLVKAGLLPGNASFSQEATLADNDCGCFQDRWVYLKTSNARRRMQDTGCGPQDKCVWTRSLPEVISLPIAHGEGKFIPKSEEVLERLRQEGQIVLRYCDARGVLGDHPVNPNGSVDSVAGLCDPTGRVFGLMPHPERHLTGLQHPHWTRTGSKKHGDGFQIFANAVQYYR